MNPQAIPEASYLRSISLQPPTEKYSGIMLLGEAPGEKEEGAGLPFVGPAGKLLDSMLEEAQLLRSTCVVTNVFHIRPPKNEVEYFFTSKDAGEPKLLAYPFRGNMYLKAEYGPEILRLLDELKKWKPKVVVALGGTALWALAGHQKVSEWIGQAIPVQSHIVLVAWHPSFLLHNKNKAYRDQVVEVLRAAKEFADVGH